MPLSLLPSNLIVPLTVTLLLLNLLNSHNPSTTVEAQPTTGIAGSNIGFVFPPPSTNTTPACTLANSTILKDFNSCAATAGFTSYANLTNSTASGQAAQWYQLCCVGEVERDYVAMVNACAGLVDADANTFAKTCSFANAVVKTTAALALGLIVAIIIGAVVALCVIVLCFYYSFGCCGKRRKSAQPPKSQPA